MLPSEHQRNAMLTSCTPDLNSVSGLKAGHAFFSLAAKSEACIFRVMVGSFTYHHRISKGF